MSLFTVGCEVPSHVIKSSWNTVVVDANGNVGEYSSIVIDRNSKAHITYFDYLIDEQIGDASVPFGNIIET